MAGRAVPPQSPSAYGGLERFLARALGLVAPGAALGYLRRHAELARATGYGAASLDEPYSRWRPLDGNINTRNARDRRLVQARARQLVDDNPNVSGALEKILANVVSPAGIRPQARLADAAGRPLDAANKSLEQDFCRWAARVEWRALLELALRHCWTDGGCLLRWTPRRDFLSGGLVPLGVELLPVDALDSAKTAALPNGNQIWQGIEVNPHGEAVAWHVREAALDGGLAEVHWRDDLSLTGESVRLPASNCRMVMRKKRIGQLLPISWLHSVIMTMSNLGEYQESEQVAARLASAFGVYVVLPEGISGNDLSGNAIRSELQPNPDFMADLSNGRAVVERGRIDVLPAGAKIEQARNDRPGTSFEPYVRASLRSASAGLNMSAEAFSNDFSQASYSSVRQSVLEERRGYRMLQSFLIEQVCQPLWEAFCAMRGVMRGHAADSPAPVRWQTAGWSWVDPQKDANAAKTRRELGLVSSRMLCEEQGYDYDEVQAQIAAEDAGKPTAPAPVPVPVQEQEQEEE